MDNEGGAVFGEDIFIKPEEKYVSVRFLQRFAVIPRRRTDKAVICSLIPPVEKGAAVAVLQTTQDLDTFHDVFHGDPFAEILKQPVAEGFKANRRKHDLYILASRERQDLRKISDAIVDVIDPADQIDPGKPDLVEAERSGGSGSK